MFVKIQWGTTQHERGRNSHTFSTSETEMKQVRLEGHCGCMHTVVRFQKTEVKLWVPEAGTRVFIIVYHVTFES